MSRIAQIRNMRDRCRSINPVSSTDDTRWYIQLVNKDMVELYKIFVYIPRDFPTSPPQITVSHILEHSWVNASTKVVQHPELVSWKTGNDLGNILVDILQEFTTKKPRVIKDDSARRDSAQSSVSQSAGSYVEVLAMPAIPADFPELQALSVDELENLDKDPSVLDSFISTLPLMQTYHKMKDAERKVSLSTAQEALLVHDDLKNSQKLVNSLGETLEGLRKDLETVLDERDQIMSHYTPKYLLKDLSELSNQTDRDSARFLDSQNQSEEAKSAYLQQRILYHKSMALSDLLTVHSASRIIGSPRNQTK